MERISVSSSNLASVGYDEGTQTLEVEFVSGSIYEYYDVPANVHQELISAPSIGGYFSQRIRNSYAYSIIG